MELRYQYNSYKLNAQTYSIIMKFKYERQGFWWDAPGLALVLLMVTGLDWC
jgi:hypothetical protein